MINRAKMPRQLRNKGGITNVTPRTNYLFGGIKKRIRKLIPNELADVAVKAAPFVAMIPGYGPAAAGIMRGVGRFDQRGSLSDAFKQGLLTYGGGKLFGAGMERAGLRDPGASGIGDFFNQGTRDRAGNFFKGGEKSKKLIDTPPGGGDPKGLKSVIEGAKKLDNIPIIGELPNMVKQQILIGGVSGAATYVYEAFLKEEPPQEEGETYEEYIARRKENVGRKMKGYFDNYFKFDKEYSSMTPEQKQAFIDRVNVKDGGRIGFSKGSDIKIKLKQIGYEDTLLDTMTLKELIDLLDSEEGTFTDQGTYREPAKKGGMPTGIMKTNKAGVMERDYRDKGGFVPVGIKEKADDVPAMLSKNEFVMTADAVRGAGNGSIDKGAQRMYDTMKNLEKRVV